MLGLCVCSTDYTYALEKAPNAGGGRPDQCVRITAPPQAASAPPDSLFGTLTRRVPVSAVDGFEKLTAQSFQLIRFHPYVACCLPRALDPLASSQSVFDCCCGLFSYPRKYMYSDKELNAVTLCLRLTGTLKTDLLSPKAWCGLWLRVDSDSPTTSHVPLFFDNQASSNRAVTGRRYVMMPLVDQSRHTLSPSSPPPSPSRSEWKSYVIEAKVPWRPDPKQPIRPAYLNWGVVCSGPGTVWAYHLELEAIFDTPPPVPAHNRFRDWYDRSVVS
jgi:hypothetical protein